MNILPAPEIAIDQEAARDALLLHLMRGGTWGHYWTPDGEPYTKDGRTVTPKYTQWFDAGAPKQPIPSWLEKNLYWGVHPCVQRGIDPDIKPNKQRSSVAIVQAVNCFFAEFDGKNYVQPDEYVSFLPADFAGLPAHDQRAAVEDAQEAAFPLAPAAYKARAWDNVKRMALAPSVVVDSGGGFHVYHLLAEPLIVDDDSRQHIADVQAAWVRLVNADPQSKDLARVLRVPGTYNRKPYFAPDFPLVTVLLADFGRLYKMAEFDRLTVSLRAERQAQVVSIGANNGYHGDTFEEAADALRRLAVWRCDDREEWIRVGMALKAGLGDAGLELWDQWSHGSRKYQPGDCEGRWKGLRPSDISLGTLLWRAHQDNPKPKARPEFEYEYGFVVETPDPATLEIELTAEERKAATQEEKAKHQSWPYSVKDGRMVLLHETRDGDIESDPIADFAVTIAEEIADENGNVHLVLAGKGLRRGVFQCEISGQDFGSEARLLSVLTAATGGIDVVYSGMHKHLRVAIGKLTAEGSRAQRIRYYRTGWQDDSFLSFLMPGMDDSTLISVPRQIAYEAPKSHTDIIAGLAALVDLVEAMDTRLTAPIVAALFMPPMLRPAGLGNERVAIFIAGRTGSLKTSWTQTAMCLYGPGFASNDNLLKLGEGATRNAIMAFAAHAHDLPLMIDNYKPNTGNGKHDLINLIHNILEGGDRKRSERSGALRDSKLIRCIPIVTGEDLPRDDAASLARILLVTFAWQRGEANDHLTAAQENSEHLCTVGWSWLQWLQSPEGHTVAKATAKAFPRLRSEWSKYLAGIDKNSANIARIASNLAVNQLAWQMVLQHPVIGPVLSPYTAAHTEGLRAIARTMAQSTVEALEAHQYRNALRELLNSNQYKIIDRAAGRPTDADRDRVLGWKDSSGVYLLPAIALAAIKKLLGPTQFLISPQTLYGQMVQLGWLADKGKGSTTKVISMDKEKIRVLHLLPSFLDGDDDGGAIDAGSDEDGGEASDPATELGL